MEENGDPELLRRFAARGEETAFTELVKRHAPMVRGVALRRTGGDAELTEEITQSVFTALARKAYSVPAGRLAGWLHKAAVLEARNARRKAERHRRAMRRFGAHSIVTMNQPSASPSEDAPLWRDFRPHLDTALSRLPEKARHPVVLRYFESRSIREIALEAGRSEAAIRKEIERALERLSVLLKRRGVSTTGSALAAMLAGQSLCAPAASAAPLAAAALRAASLLSSSAPLFSSFASVMAAVQTKTAVAALLLATVPSALLWRQNTALREEVHSLRTALDRQNGTAVVPSIKPADGPSAVRAASTAAARTAGETREFSRNEEEFLKLAAKTTIELLGPDAENVTGDFTEMFKLKPSEAAAAVAAVHDAMRKVQTLEQARLEILFSDTNRTEFQIERFDGESVKRELLENLRGALPPLAYEYIRRDPERHFRYKLAGFGTSRRVFTLETARNPVGDEKWLMTEKFYEPVGERSVAWERGEREIEGATYYHRFSEIPFRFSSLLEAPPAEGQITLKPGVAQSR